MKNNSLIIMEGEMQKRYKHEVPKRSLSKAPLPRINITFRLFKE
jgi:alkylated DNA repair dioxygenase AlkB